MSQPEDTVLVVEDDDALRDALLDTLQAAGIAVLGAPDAAAAIALLKREDVGLVITDVQMPGADGYQLLATCRRLRPDVAVVLMTAYGTIEKAVAAMRDGATDYLVKPFDARALIELARRQLARRAVPPDLVAVDPESRRLVALATQIAQTDATVLITGDSGTGKEVYARYIRDQSARRDAPFVAINCAAIPENMLEATLFGHEKGAFTGALGAHPGKFEQAQKGTLLLDEISEMTLGLQAKILRVLQEREVERLGGTRAIALDVRVIATSNRQLEDEARAGRFRADLYYRLNVMPLRLPPLRVRRADVLPLARRAMQGCARADHRVPELTADAERCLLSYDWPGNVRELANVVQRAALLAIDGRVTAEALEIPRIGPAPAVVRADVADGAPLDRDLRDREQALILATLASTAGSRKLAAEKLGISERTLRHKLQRLRAAGVAVPGAHSAVLAGATP